MVELVKPLPKRTRRRSDKIFDNKFNVGEVEFVPFEKNIEIEPSYIKSQKYESYNAYEYHRMTNLHIIINEIYTGTKWDKAYLNKKIPKFELSEIFNFIQSKIKDKTYSDIEVFIQIAEYLGVKYITLYEMVPTTEKKKLLEELDEKFKIKNQLRTYKLF